MGMNPLKIILTFAFLFASSSFLLAADEKPELIVELGKNQIYEGESVQYQVTLNHVDKPTEPDMSAFTDFQVKLLGTQPMNSRFTQIINGERTDIVRRGMSYLYSLTPLKSGELTVPAPTVTLTSGETLVGRTFSLEVKPPSEQDMVKMSIAASPQSVFPTQEFEVTLAVAIKALPDELADREPLSFLRRQLPQLEIPWCSDQHLPEGIQPKTDIKDWLTDLQSHSGSGFGINNVTVQSGFMFDMDRRPAAFEPAPKKVTLPDAEGKDTTYWFYEFPRRFVADRPGEFTFGPATLKGAFVTGFSGEGQLRGENIFVTARPITVTVNDVPTENQPESFCGAVGRFTGWTATFNPTQTRVDSPVTLTLTLSGTGSTADVKPLDLAKVPEVADHFKTYEGTRQDERGEVKFVYTLRPKSEKITEFPAVPLSYFDVATGKYETLTTRPIPIEVGPAERLSTSQIVGAAGLMNQGHELQVSSEGVFANVTDPGEVYDQSPQPELWFGLLAVLTVAYLLLLFGTKRYRRLHQDVERVRRRSAVGRARGRIAEGRKLLGAGQTTQGAEAVHAAFARLIAAAAGLPESGMTTADACRRLKEFGAEEQLIHELRELFETCDATRYGGADATLHGLVDKLDTLFNQTVTTLKKQKRLK